ncbi:MAG: type II secretion system F family protein [Candidatus Hodarchaeaceae archaeon]|nr:type II secretion system F family protein [Candidatus Hodarchaeaceae archaeon]
MVRRLAIRLFGRWTQKRKYDGLRERLGRARMMVSADAYVSVAIFYSIVVSATVAISGSLVLWLVHFFTLPMLASIFLVAIISGFLTYRLFLFYPSLAANERAHKIDLALPHTVSFMHALSRSGATVTDILKEFSARPDMGELAEEASIFMRDVEFLGQDPLTALRNLSRSTVSKRFKTFLETLTSIIETGGDMTGYFASKCSEYQTEVRDEQKKFIETLGLLAEIYVIMLVFAPLLILLLLVTLGAMGGIPVALLFLVAYVAIPLGSAIFMVLVKIISGGGLKIKLGKGKPPEAFKGVSVRGEAVKKEMLGGIARGITRTRLKAAILHPFKTVSENPHYAFFVSVPAAVIFSIILSPFSTTTAFFATLIILAPYVIAYESKSRRVGRMEGALLGFLRSLTSGVKSGLTLPRAMAVASTSDLGPLGKEVRRMGADIRWGMSAAEALARFEARVKDSGTVSWVATLIRKANEAESDISDVLEVLMDDVATTRSLQRERRAAMATYQVIIFLVFFVFLFTVYMVVKNIVLMAAPVAGGMEMLLFGGIDPRLCSTVFMHATILEGLFAGLVGTQMGEGDLRSGLKYSLLMMVAAYAVFAVLIFPAI